MVRRYVGPYVAAGMSGSVGHLYHVPLLLPHAPILSCPILSLSLNKYVQQWDHAWVMPTRKWWPLRLGMKELSHLHVATLLTLAPQCSTFT